MQCPLLPLTDVDLEQLLSLIHILEADGPLALTIKEEGSYKHQNQNKMKFCIRMYINKDSSDIRFVHTFFFDGDEQTDFLKGLGIRFDTVLELSLIHIWKIKKAYYA